MGNVKEKKYASTNEYLVQNKSCCLYIEQASTNTSGRSSYTKIDIFLHRNCLRFQMHIFYPEKSEKMDLLYFSTVVKVVKDIII